MTLSAAPSWVSTSLRYLEAKHPRYRIRIRSASATGEMELFASLERMKFRMVEIMELAGSTHETWVATLRQMVDTWDDECHRQMREFLEEGGYDAEHKKMVATTRPAPPAPKAPKKAPPLDSPTAVSDTELESVVRNLRPPSQHTPEQELEEAVAVERLQRDPNLGAW